ncbi:unnamed protein product [Owenia fusiformis]|uniref:Protein-tyrosine-phosphatase n=1 Tax=Owenia fusiformis TaxID=6347 RepID=A0A8J1TQ84_OWEFU|nr:unnamed protein product [Owenia fusiformis]
MPVGRNVLQLTNVKESANYTCVAVSELGNIESVATVKVKAMPNPPTSLHSSDVTPNSVKLTWHPGNVEPIESYIVQYKRHGEDSYSEIPNIRGREYVVQGLEAYTKYDFRVVAVNNVGRGLPSIPRDEITGEMAPGSPPREVKAQMISASTVTMSWIEPEIPNGVIKGYEVIYTLSPDLPISLWTLHRVNNVNINNIATIPNLATNRTYTFQVLAFTDIGSGPLSDPIKVKTQQGVPFTPNNLQGEAISPNEIVLHWERPEESGESITSYELRYNDSHFRQNIRISIKPPVETYTLTDLTPSTVYHIQVSAKSERGEGPQTPIIQIKTEQFIPTAAPQNIQGETLSARSIRITWEPPPRDKQNGDITGYKVLYTTVASNQGTADAEYVETSPGRLNQDITGLNKWTEYKVWMLARTSVGEGPVSKPITVWTDESVPGEPRKVRVEAINSTHVRVEWKPPSNRDKNGIIRGYQVHWVAVNEHKEPIGLANIHTVMNASQHFAIISKLQHDTNYQFQVAAYTRKGDGQRSRGRTIKTKGAVPSKPTELTLELTQTDPPVVSVMWESPEKPYGVINNYKVEYRRKDDIHDSKDEELIGERFQFETDFLDKGTEYEFLVSAKNGEAYGEAAVETITTPDGIPAAAPMNFTITGISSTSVNLAWDPPPKKQRNGVIVQYEILYHKSSDFIMETDVNTTDMSTEIQGLEMDTDYTFKIKAYTTQGAGPWSHKVPFTTFGQLPPPPKNIEVRRTSPTSLEVSWDHPIFQVAGYRVWYNGQAVPDINQWSHRDIGPFRVTEISGLDKTKAYAVRIQSKSNDGRYSNLSEIAVDSFIPPERPDMVTNFHVVTQDKQSVMLEWDPPKRPGVQRYKIVYYGRGQVDNDLGNELPRRTKTVTRDNTRAYIENLNPNSIYNFNISAKFENSWGPAYHTVVETNKDAPPVFPAPVPKVANPDDSVTVQLTKASEEHGKLSHYLVVVVPEHMATKDTNLYTEDELSPPEDDDLNPLMKPYITAWFSPSDLPEMFNVGDQEIYGRYVNRPLIKGQTYKMFVRAFSTQTDLYTSSKFSKSLRTDMVVQTITSGPISKNGNIWLIIGVIGGVLFLVIVCSIIAVICVQRRKSQRKQAEVNHKEPGVTKALMSEVPAHPTDPVEMRRLNFQTPAMMNHPPIDITDLANHIDRLKANDNLRFSQEYESIEPGQSFTWENSHLEVNKPKNRYANVSAYDHSRVILQPVDGIPGSDYINANYMDGYRKQNAYIATQGAMPETFGDFWRMVWEQRSATIVMMTKLEERTRIKCDQYWPNRGTETYGLMHVTLIDVTELATYTIRTFQISRRMRKKSGEKSSKHGYGEKREIRQFQFTAWPDHGVPDHPTPLLLFMKRVRNANPPDAGAMVVHCSAGVGRTGAFIVIDSMLERIKHERRVDIYGHVTCLRAQRNYMVQTEDQYIFIHDALLEAVQSLNTEVPARNLYAHIQKLTQPEPGETVTGMELEFKKLASIKANPSRFVSANLPVNKFKNRLVNILPYESSRVCLQPFRGVDGSDYINASFIDGYRYRQAYVATQGPLAETTEDFWRMLWEHNSTIIVMLTKLREMGREKCHQYWPSERSQRYLYFVVDPMAEYNMPSYILREFKVTDARDGQSRTIRQFQFTDWPEQGVPKSGEGFIDFIGQVHKTKEQFGQDGPITVHCSAGVGRTGVFITLSIALDRMRYEGVVDMFQTVKMLRTQRPAMVQTEDQFQFCYRAALEYLGSFDHYAN